MWASLWSDRGYAERAAFGIDQSRAAMAVLVQPVVPHAAHVVAITTNTVKPGPIPAYFLNLLPSGALVTDADSASAEQLLLFDDEPACAEVLCFSGESDASLLPDALLTEARDMLKTVDSLVRRDARNAPAPRTWSSWSSTGRTRPRSCCSRRVPTAPPSLRQRLLGFTTLGSLSSAPSSRDNSPRESRK